MTLSYNIGQVTNKSLLSDYCNRIVNTYQLEFLDALNTTI